MLNEKNRNVSKAKPKNWKQVDSTFNSVEDKEVEDRAVKTLKEFQEREREDHRVPVKEKNKTETDSRKFS